MPVFGTVNTQTDLTGSGTLIINGTRPPTDTDGAVGDYWLDTAGKTLYGPKSTVPSYGASQVPVSQVPNTPTTIGGSTVGSKVRALVNGRATALRYYRQPGIGAANTVTLQLFLQASQAELGRAVLNNTGAEAGGWVNVTLATPIVLTPTAYRIGCSVSPGTTPYGMRSAFTATSDVPASIAIDGNCFVNGSAAAYPGTDTTGCYFVDLVFQPQTAGLWPIAIKSAP